MRRIGISAFFILSVFALHSQDTATKAPTPYYPYPLPFPSSYPLAVDSSVFVHPKLNSPIVGAGPGLLSYFGDLNTKGLLSPSISRMAFHLSFSEYMTPYLMFSARALFGSLSANEAGPRFANFESSIHLGGVNFTYNFDNFLPKKRRIDPFITTGLEYFEFLSKTDLMDASRNRYYYWKDGSIKNMPENDPNAANAIPLSRDYKYESDIRTANKEIFGKYPERSFAIPVGAGVSFHLAPRWEFKLGATMHYTRTDYIDGITDKNKGTGKGNSKKDKFLETYFTLTFDIFNPNPPFISPLSDADFLALEEEDTDADGVKDFDDKCPGTPAGVTVDAGGCPPDSDGDGVPDYLDKEVNSPPNSLVDEFGVAMDDSTIALNYRIWSDTANQYVTYKTVVNPVASAEEGWTQKRTSTIVYRRELVVLLGSYKEGVPPAEMSKILSVPDVRNSLQPDSTTAYITGSFDRTTEAEKRRDELKASGFPNARVMVKNRDGSLSEPGADLLAGTTGTGKEGEKGAGKELPKETGKETGKEVVKETGKEAGKETGKETGKESTKEPAGSSAQMKGVVYRVQLGAYSKKLSPSVFNGAGQMLEIKTEDGLYKYVSGSHSTIQDAMKRRDELVKKGYNGAFVVAYKDGKRVPLSSASGGIVQPKNESMEEPKTPKSAMDKKLVHFSVQVGAFVNEPPADILQKFSKIPGLEKKKKSSGVTQYLAGHFNNYEEAKKFRDELGTKYGIKDAFLVAFFKDEMITVQEAVELLK